MKSPFNNSKTFISELKFGNEAAYQFLFTNFYSDLLLYAISLTNDEAKAEDVVQETMVNLWQQRASLNIHTSLKNYLYKSVYHSFIKGYRKRKSELRLIEKLTFETLEETLDEDKIIQQERLNKVQSLIETLPPRCKEIFLLSKKEGLLYKEIGDELNISVKTVETQISKAFSFIRKEVLSKD